MTRLRSRPGNPNLVLAIILTVQLMIVLDASIVITALPEIHSDLGFSPTGLSWVQNAYILTFGGLLLLGARAGDLLGRRRVFVAGLSVFVGASLLGGLAQSEAWLLGARALQGIGAAIAAPSTLALLTTTFAEGSARTRAISMYSSASAAGASIGVLLGGLLTDLLSWRWGLFINVPIGLVMVALAPVHLPDTEPQKGDFDLPGAATSVAGMTAAVYGFIRAATEGWGDTVTVGAFAAALVLLAAFVRIERRAQQPITPLHLFADRTRSGAYAARMLTVGGMFSMFFFLTQYLQGVRGESPLQAGLTFLPLTLVLFALVRVVPRAAARIGDLPLLVGGLLLAATGMAWLSQITESTGFLSGIFAPLLLIGVGMAAAFTTLTTAGIHAVEPADAGAASGLVNVAHQVGGAIGIAVLVNVFAGAGGRSGSPADLAHGLSTALSGSVVCLLLALTVVIAVMWRPAFDVLRTPVGSFSWLSR
jgi:EmrB/QacA subfamily drug resistance transporter